MSKGNYIKKNDILKEMISDFNLLSLNGADKREISLKLASFIYEQLSKGKKMNVNVEKDAICEMAKVINSSERITPHFFDYIYPDEENTFLGLTDENDNIIVFNNITGLEARKEIERNELLNPISYGEYEGETIAIQINKDRFLESSWSINTKDGLTITPYMDKIFIHKSDENDKLIRKINSFDGDYFCRKYNDNGLESVSYMRKNGSTNLTRVSKDEISIEQERTEKIVDESSRRKSFVINKSFDAIKKYDIKVNPYFFGIDAECNLLKSTDVNNMIKTLCEGSPLEKIKAKTELRLKMK